MRLLTLAEVARKWAQPYGIKVIEEAGWQGRGVDLTSPDAALRHWTAGSPNGIWPSGYILTHGRTGVPGPLCNLSQDRMPAGSLDNIRVVAAGKANHAGLGSWNGISGNYRSLGLEIEWSGPNEHFSDQRILVSEIAMRILMDFCGANDNDACEHREWAPTRKIDTNLDGNVLRRRMSELRVAGPGQNPPTPADPQEEEMDLIVRGDATPEWWQTDGMTKTYLPTKQQAGSNVFLGFAKWNAAEEMPFVVPQSYIDNIPENKNSATAPTTITDADAVKIAKATVAEIAS